MNYKLGKLPARDSVKLKLKDYLTFSVVPPTKFGHYDLETNWGLLGNDQYGDCVWAGAGHETILWNKEADKTITITEQDALNDYSAVTGFNPDNPSSDQGTDMQVAAAYRQKTGITDGTNRHKITAYVALSVGDKTELKQAIYLFSAVGVGINFPASAMTQFNDGKPWTIVKSSIEGGHYVPAVGYDSKYVYVVTWGKIQKMSWGFLEKYNDESLAYISLEMLTNNKSLEGFDLAQLQTDLKQL